MELSHILSYIISSQCKMCMNSTFNTVQSNSNFWVQSSSKIDES